MTKRPNAIATPSVPGDAAPSSEFAGTGLSLVARRTVVGLLYVIVLFLSRWLAYQLRFDFVVPKEYQYQVFARFLWYVPTQLAFLAIFGQFSGILRFFGLREARRLFYAIASASVVLYLLRAFAPSASQPPRGVILLAAILSFVSIAGLRASWRMYYAWQINRRLPGKPRQRRLGIVGAGDAGADLVQELKDRPGMGLLPVVMFDDDRNKWHAEVHGVPVEGSPDRLEAAAKIYQLEEIIIAMPTAARRRVREVVDLAQKLGLRTVTLPSLGQLAAGHVLVSQLRPVKFEDVLGREPVELRLEEIKPLIEHQVVLVTGAGGSIGSELCRQVATFHPRKLLLVEQSEGQLFLIEQELIKAGHAAIIVPLVADILDEPRMRAVLAEHRPQALFHAAAHKHVTMMERQPGEAIKNNSLGTAGLAELAAEHGVQRFVLISTDKAVNPTNVMGATKRVAELYVQGLAQAQPPGGTRFIAVRFGNVLGSSGSVVPIFARQIAEGGPVTVTDAKVERYFMTIPEAVGLVLQSFALGAGGEVFVLEMGSLVKIADMARTMIRLSGFEPDRDIEIVYTGLRPGEKINEELVHDGATDSPTAHPRIKRLNSPHRSLAEIKTCLEFLKSKVAQGQPDELKRALQQVVPEYTPHLTTTVAANPPPALPANTP